MISAEEYIAANIKILPFYNPYNFDRNITESVILKYETEKINSFINENNYAVIENNGENFLFIYKKLEWDSNYFKMPVYRITYLLSRKKQNPAGAINYFIKNILPPSSYCFIEVPSEDTKLLQALGENSFKLVETRLTYYNNALESHDHARYPVREAAKEDIANLKSVASCMRNEFDRFHADSSFSPERADSFLATYIENSVLGFSDIVMVPAGPSVPADSFLTANYLESEWEKLKYRISKMVLSAVSSQTNKGWYIKLISEMTYHLRDNKGCQCVFLTTQSTNRAVYNTWEKLRYKLGSTTHIFSLKKL